MRIIGNSSLSVKGERPYLEDFILADEDNGIVALADGFGGPAGTEASRMVAESARDFVIQKSEDLEATLPFELKRSFSLIQNVLSNAFSYANDRLLKWNASRHIYERGGASLSMAILYQGVLTIGQSGSNSIWIARRGEWTRLLCPRSLGFRNDLKSHGGGMSQIPLGALGLMEDFEVGFQEFKVQPGDWLLITSAGVHPGLVQEIQSLTQAPQRGIKEIAEKVQTLGKARQETDKLSISLSIFN